MAGRRVLIARSADRAQPLAALLETMGAEPLVLPLIDFERAEDQILLDAALERLSAGGFDWLVITSINTVRALMEKAAERGVALAGLVPAGTKVATVGPTTQRVLESFGLTVALAPTKIQSAEGLLSLWNSPSARVFLPQADIAPPGLQEGLEARGAEVTAVPAYRTVDFPAREEHRLAAELPSAVVLSDHVSSQKRASSQQRVSSQTARLLTPREALDAHGAGTIDAVVAASPSAARRIAEVFPALGSCRLIAIGRPTAAEASRLGLTVAAIASTPTPDGIVAALASVFANEGNLP